LGSPSEVPHATSAFEARAILVDQLTEPDALPLAWQARRFDAILGQDEEASSHRWLQTLQARVASRTPVVVVGVGDAHSIAQALAAVCRHASAANTRSIERHVHKLRKKCGLISSQQMKPLNTESVYASGYRRKE